MFSFHKPRTYRSTEGCCICKAKSSSSRFTDSRKFERDTIQCFGLKYPRQGEICNACVLKVKRYQRRPVGSTRNWSHVVDAKAGIGPGCNKIQTKYKSERINSRAALANNFPQTSNSSSAGSSVVGIGGLGVVANTSNSLNCIPSYMPEKYTKIFKKTKKIKDKEAASSAMSGHSSKRKSTNNGWSQSGSHSLPTTPDSFDSDYEDARIHGSLAGNQGGSGTVVQFQTQTRASAYRAQAAAEARNRLLQMGSKRKKLTAPRRYLSTTTNEESTKFFDKDEWEERKACCGKFYECAALGGTLLIDVDCYKPCEKHRANANERQYNLTQTATSSENKSIVMPLQKTIIQTVPAVVQLQPPQQALASTLSITSTASLIHHTSSSFKTTSSSSSSSATATTTTTATVTATPVLKKHHLYFKRQSECFPQGDVVINAHNTANNVTNSSTSSLATAHVVDIIKTESEFNAPTSQQYYPHVSKSSSSSSNNSSSTINLQRHNDTTNPLISSALSISVTPSTSSLCSSSTMPQMPKHSLAKVTNISPTSVSSCTAINSSHTVTPLAKPSGLLHKIKTADSGKIHKHSFDKLNTAVRFKTSDIQDIKPLIKTVDKSYILAKQTTQANVISLNAINSSAATAAAAASAGAQCQSLAAYNVTAQQQPTITASPSAASPTSSTSSTSSSTKFSDNSSDSGFDENMLDRKSASPLQEDCEKKLLSRSNVQTMFLTSGVQIQGQSQNVILTANDVAASILQNRKNAILNNNSRSNNYHHPTTTAVKIAQISTNSLATSSQASSGATSLSLAAQAKMRAIYNNNNTIQHENGITTIVPASSLAASTQTAAMQNIAPSTVTITPTPPVGTTQFNTQNIISRKLTTANVMNLQSNTNIQNNNTLNNITTNNNHHHQHHHQQQQQQQQQQHHHHNLNSNNSNTAVNVSSSSANQKIILLKTSSNSTTITPAATNYNHLHTTTPTLSGGVGGGGGGLRITR